MKSKNKKEIENRRENVIYNLPEFVNLLVLFMGSGTNLEDSLKKIISSYIGVKNIEKDYFKNEMTNLLIKSDKTGESLTVLFHEFSRKVNIKELTRLSNIMIENRLKGTTLWEKLKNEGEEIWKERKRISKEKIKLLDSKLAFPLSLTLVSLIIIAASPALLEIS